MDRGARVGNRFGADDCGGITRWIYQYLTRDDTIGTTNVVICSWFGTWNK